MKGLGTNNSCSHGGDMLAYLYSEMAGEEREVFEVHLADCGTCIDDFAELSQSRYPVYEWKRTQFDPLPTPRVVIPFETPGSISLLDQIRRAFSFRPTLAFGGLGAAMITVVIAGYLILSSTSGDTEVAREVEPSASPTRALVVPSTPSVDATTQERIEVAVRNERPTVVRASTSAKSPAPKPKSARQPKRDDSIPVMSSIEEEDDDSLRLADIFEEIGTSE
ncbi:MAG: zf-HC2 domain-containing protein [bacterium]|nr:zf-HC2 domain-containing protein [bacterium]